MKLLAVGCLHGSAPKRLAAAVKKEKPDAVLCLGDLCEVDLLRDIEFGNFDSIEVIEALLNPGKYKKLVEKSARSMQVPLRFFGRLKVPVFLVYGNNDYLGWQVRGMGLKSRGLEASLPENVLLLKSRLVKFKGIFLAGFSGYKGLNEKTGKHASYERRLAGLVKKIRLPEITIFMAHDVPHGKFDLVRWKRSPALGKRVGEKLFNRMLRGRRMLAFICAHMHEHQGIDALYGTPVIAAGYGRAGKFATIEIHGGKIGKIKFFR